MNSSITSLSSLDRRAFLSRAGLLGTATAMVPALASVLATAASADAAVTLPPPGAARDIAIFRVALNIEYLEAEFYTYATTGRGLADTGIPIDGTGTPGGTIVKANPQVPFQNALVRDFASELAFNERNHVKVIRQAISAAGQTPPAKAAINLREAFDMVAQNAGIAPTFDPFADDVSFLLAAFTFEEVGVTAFNGGAPLLTLASSIKSSSGILAVEAYQAAAARVQIVALGGDFGISAANKISALRASLSNSGGDDQGLTNPNGGLNIVPTDDNSIAFSRNLNSALNIIFGAKGATSGLFYPQGINV